MNSFLFSAITICLAAQCALAQYNSYNNAGGYQQRKMSPSPQTYGHQQQAYGGQEMMAQGYGAQSYGAQEQSYSAPSSASVSHYDERTPASSNSYNQKSAGYGKQSASYGQASGYGQQAATYAKAAPKYEEPYYPPMPFAWGYDINDGYGGAQYHKENGDEYGKRTGSYGYTDAYGIYRQVDYVADENGFRATIKTNEPGTANEAPADVELHAYEPPSNYYAGNKDSGYSAPAAKSSYSQAQSTYSAPAATYAPVAQTSYAPKQATQNYNNNQYQQRSSYSARPAAAYSAPATYSAPAARPAYQQAAEQYSSSSIVPVYQKSAMGKPLAAAPAKRSY